MAKKRKTFTTLGLLVVLALAWWRLPELTDAANTAGGGDAQVAQLFAEERSGDVIESSGRVIAVLPDDDHGSRHQRFLLELEPGLTLLVAHNIDLAPRIPGIRKGDAVAFRGQYEWNPKGGVVHWTHHDPDGRRPGGWLRHDGETYR
jgi:hypothetical protein